ncbi:DsbA family protein [Sphingomonas flavalba]|uniref:DsbA family protein n=1 Tax=Sphingomonas flavalba TaxID=2559804 RepID=UPI00109D9D6D|nr:thioredoxin domain-containing protein [Sphingomonas flavalba]
MAGRWARWMVLALGVALLPGAAPKTDWTRHVTVTATGAYVLGNPAAKVKLVEYASYTCPHCAHYANDSKAPIRRDFIADGSTSVELRHAVRDRLDFIATLLARCGGPARFFATSDAIFAAQESWMDKAIAFERANAERLSKMPRDDAVREEARATGLFAIAEAEGVPAKKLDACLADAEQQKLIGAMADRAWNEEHIPGTPSFTINGTQVPNAASWAMLEPALRAAKK